MDDRSAELREFFTDCDANADGQIQLSEFSTLLKHTGTDVSDTECKVGFESIDRDRDGHIDFEEFLSWWNER
ncbi:MAG: EF-hand domain-containing protein [Pseudomonadales bacterium]